MFNEQILFDLHAVFFKINIYSLFKIIMKLLIFFVAITLSLAFPAPPQSNLRESRSLNDLLRNLKNWNPADVAVSAVKFKSK